MSQHLLRQGKKANKQFFAMEPGDVPTAFADIEPLQQDLGFSLKPLS
ncbi:MULTISPECIES: hypothetical protein [Crocosphaera]|uniref:Uncharacterized protein n=3 Tax=Crocosphaera watsonii TaxID=263511 RepID=T2JQB3_CROWT|nr:MULTISPECIES: hypothetical protein [Crocosphaera]EHJ11975.1 hypothetical protein CWATWH0003_3303 [Crocosphaera watsonii WH 0003]MCH2244734.1 hypothetical protein [Crocosphaera sp.]CCQ55954.1 hypothetical protein CWATWH0005_2035 [Crocosphaera watsonii WH 0005]CCQ68053.1 hypothetical protein CWATWH0402_4755 [Crocosphaera watsonii WH 0402]